MVWCCGVGRPFFCPRVNNLLPLLAFAPERTTVERVNGRLKDEFGARHIRVRGHGKVLCHLMFGVLALTVDQLLRLLN